MFLITIFLEKDLFSTKNEKIVFKTLNNPTSRLHPTLIKELKNLFTTIKLKSEDVGPFFIYM